MYMANFRIKEICAQKGMTQKDLAEKVGITPVGLAKSLKGNTTIATLEKIALALGVPLSALFEAPREGVVCCPKCGAELRLSAAIEE